MRHTDWVPRLRDAIETHAEAPFAWGIFDCSLAAGTLARALGDRDPAAPFAPTARGPRYKTPHGALGIQRRYLGRRLAAGESLLEAVAEKRAAELGLAEVAPGYAQRGDLVLAQAETEDGFEDVLAVVDLSGRGLITAARGAGWARLPLAAGRRAWRI